MNQGGEVTVSEFGSEPRVKKVREAQNAGLGAGKIVGIFGFGPLLLGLLILVAVGLLVAHYAPFASLEGVGP